MANLQLIKELRERTNLSLNDCKKALEESNDNIELAIDLLKKWGELKGKEKSAIIATEGIILSGVDSTNIAVIVEINCQTDFVAKSQDFLDFSHTYFKHLLTLDDYVSDHKTKMELLRHKLMARTGENITIRRFYRFARENCKNIHLASYNHIGNRLAVIAEISFTDTKNKEFIAFADDIALQIAAMSPTSVSKDDIPAEVKNRQFNIFKSQLIEDKKPTHMWDKVIEGKFNKWKKENVLLEQDSIKEQRTSIEQMRQDLSKKLCSEIKINGFVRYALGEGLVKKKEDLADEVSKLIG